MSTLTDQIMRTPGIDQQQAEELARWLTDVVPCPACHGNGREDEQFSLEGEYLGYTSCPACNGTGVDATPLWQFRMREFLDWERGEQ